MALAANCRRAWSSSRRASSRRPRPAALQPEDADELVLVALGLGGLAHLPRQLGRVGMAAEVGVVDGEVEAPHVEEARIGQRVDQGLGQEEGLDGALVPAHDLQREALLYQGQLGPAADRGGAVEEGQGLVELPLISAQGPFEAEQPAGIEQAGGVGPGRGEPLGLFERGSRLLQLAGDARDVGGMARHPAAQPVAPGLGPAHPVGDLLGEPGEMAGAVEVAGHLGDGFLAADLGE